MQSAPDQEPKTREDVDKAVLEQLEENQRNWLGMSSDLTQRETWRNFPRKSIRALGLLLLMLLIYAVGTVIDEKVLHHRPFKQGDIPVSVIVLGTIVLAVSLFISRFRMR